jgi:hypothetical protein
VQTRNSKAEDLDDADARRHPPSDGRGHWFDPCIAHPLQASDSLGCSHRTAIGQDHGAAVSPHFAVRDCTAGARAASYWCNQRRRASPRQPRPAERVPGCARSADAATTSALGSAWAAARSRYGRSGPGPGSCCGWAPSSIRNRANALPPGVWVPSGAPLYGVATLGPVPGGAA